MSTSRAGGRRRIAALLLLLVLPGLAKASLTPEQQQRIQASTFEVVVAKPVDDPLSYERPLPLELESYQFRNDKYFSIGTAFALGHRRYATAAHVLGVVMGSQYGTPALRDAKGRVFEIDQVHKLSLDRDFAEFTVKGEPEGAALEVERRPSTNTVVYAVGNALGTGVVTRDGLYTSDTPEEQDGRWKFMRFSAAASPGNSGGPLLDEKARVIGIVLRKSENENLNFALPISLLLDAPDDLATADQRESYVLDIFTRRHINTFRLSLKLPLAWADLAVAVNAAHDAYGDAEMKALLAEKPDTLFPNGKGAHAVLQGLWTGSTPGLIQQSDDGEWKHTVPQNVSTTDLGHNGFVTFGSIRNTTFVHLRKPDDLDSRTLYDDPQRMLDLLLQAFSLKRQVGPEQIRITSMGPAAEDGEFTDHYGRRWQVRRWLTPITDRMLLVFALPLPDGYAIMLRYPPSRFLHDHRIDLQAMTDFVYPNYIGSLAQWREYLAAAGDRLPTPLRNVTLDIGDGSRLRYGSARLGFDVPPDVCALSDRSNLELDLTYFRDHGQVVWDVAGLELYQDAHTSTGIKLIRHPQPSEDMEDSYFAWWDKIRLRKHPFDGVAYRDGDVTYIKATQKTTPGTQQGFYYTVEVLAEGANNPKVMRHRLDASLQRLNVLEHVP